MKNFKYSIDKCDKDGLQGWVMDEDVPNAPVEMKIFVDENFLCNAVANIFRQDLLSAGLGNGEHGFCVPVPNDFFNDKEHVFTLIDTVTNSLILGATKTFVLNRHRQLISEKSMIGYLDTCDKDGLQGWVMDEDAPDLPVQINVFVDEKFLCNAAADIFRQDLLSAGLGNGEHAFCVKIPDEFFDDREHIFAIGDATTNLLINEAVKTYLLNKPKQPLIPVKSSIRCRLDTCDENGITGWAIDDANPKQPVNVEIFIDGELIAHVTANLFRQDLFDAKIGNGNCGFNVVIPDKFWDGVEHSVNVCNKTKAVLNGGPKTFKLLSKLDQQNISQNLITTDVPTPKIAVVVHVYYLEIWTEIAQLLKAITHPFDLFVTTTTEQSGIVVPVVITDFPNVRFHIQPNNGMDVLPFLSLIPTLVTANYVAVCKLHTKRGDGGEVGTSWRRALLHPLIGDNAAFIDVVQAFATNADLQLTGPASLYLSAHRLMLNNESNIKFLWKQLENRPLPADDWGFFAGSMLWVRPTSLQKLAQVVAYLQAQPVEYQPDGQLSHAIERLLGLVPVFNQGQVGLLHAIVSSSTRRYLLQVVAAHTHISQAELSDILRQYVNLETDLAQNAAVKRILTGTEAFQIESKFIGNIESCDENGIVGWIVDERNPQKPVVVDVFIDRKLIARTKADVFRQNLLNAELGNGKHRFLVPIPDKFFDDKEHVFSLGLNDLSNPEISQSFVLNKKQPLSIDEIAKRIALKVKDCANTFQVEKGWVTLDLGGCFEPTCLEMAQLQKNNVSLNSMISMIKNQIIDISNTTNRLYYEVLRQNTFLEFFQLSLTGIGSFHIELITQNDKLEQVINLYKITLNQIDANFVSNPIEINTLLPNGSFIIKVKCLSNEGYINQIRWQGLIRFDLVNKGQRVVAIRTFGNRASVSNTLKSIITKIHVSNIDLLRRTLFVIYDATGDGSVIVISTAMEQAQILEIKVPNYGGGGNASVLTSMILRAAKYTTNNISEIILFDDDAHIDAETLVRHDAFIACRKPNIISTSVIYSRNRPTNIQEFGGIWGKFFSNKHHQLKITKTDEKRLFFPYLVRSNRDVTDEWTSRYLGQPQQVEFSTFIFISFPFKLMEKIGTPLPFFLRNDDAEICLRAIHNGYKVIVNPNLFAWHDSAHNPIGEFYACLHGFIVNSAYGGIDMNYLLRSYTERLSKIATVGNLVLLKAYEHGLRLFNLGPTWMKPETIYSEYAKVRSELAAIMTSAATQIPFELFDVLKRNDQVEVRSIVDIYPPPPHNEKNIVFLDEKNDVITSFESLTLDTDTFNSLKLCLEQLVHLASNVENICTSWHDFIKAFDHILFWDAFPYNMEISYVTKQDDLLSIQSLESRKLNFVATFPTSISSRLYREEEMAAIKKKYGDLDEYLNNLPDDLKKLVPENFDPIGYLSHNLDVMEAGVNPIEHWIKCGITESRQY